MRARRYVIAAAAVCGVLGVVPASARAGTAAGAWKQQHLAAHPSARSEAAMAYDAATGTVLLFGGSHGRALSDTWAWDGFTWTKQHLAAHPLTRYGAAMAYDAAAGAVVLSGGEYDRTGYGITYLGGTWVWG